MFSVKKTFTISAAHYLAYLDYDSPCKDVHGHNWKITVYCRATHLDKYGMVIDFSRIKKAVSDKLDHKTINDVGIGGLPTAENMAFYILHLVGSDVCYRVDVEETDGSIATYEEENTRMGISKQKHVYSGVRYSPGIRPDYNVLANKNAKRLGARKVR